MFYLLAEEQQFFILADHPLSIQTLRLFIQLRLPNIWGDVQSILNNIRLEWFGLKWKTKMALTSLGMFWDEMPPVKDFHLIQ